MKKISRTLLVLCALVAANAVAELKLTDPKAGFCPACPPPKTCPPFCENPQRR